MRKKCCIFCGSFNTKKHGTRSKQRKTGKVFCVNSRK